MAQLVATFEDRHETVLAMTQAEITDAIQIIEGTSWHASCVTIEVHVLITARTVTMIDRTEIRKMIVIHLTWNPCRFACGDCQKKELRKN